MMQNQHDCNSKENLSHLAEFFLKEKKRKKVWKETEKYLYFKQKALKI